jgi:predicted nucleic acid-binding protein
MRVFLDTNILIDLLDSERTHHEASTQLMRAVQRGQIRACISAISIVNAIYVMRKVMPGKVMARYLLRMLDNVELSRLEVQDLRAALAAGWNDLEDAIQHSSALASGQVDAIVSHDADMKRHAEIPVLSPKQVLQRLGR